MVWIGFKSICCSKVAKAKVALGCWYYKELLKTLKVAQKLPSTIYLCLFAILHEKVLGGAVMIIGRLFN